MPLRIHCGGFAQGNDIYLSFIPVRANGARAAAGFRVHGTPFRCDFDGDHAFD
jgi:hypothetical protein